MRRLCLTAAACLMALPAIAQTQLERMEVVSEEANRLTNAHMISELPALEGHMPDPNWDDDVRDAYACVLDGYRADAGDAAIDAMLDRIEATMAELGPEGLMESGLDERIPLPEGVTGERSVALLNTCGVMAIYMARLQASGALTILAEQ